MVMVRVLDFGFVIDDLNIVERSEVVFGIADLVEAGVVIKEWPLGQRDIGQSVSPSLGLSFWPSQSRRSLRTRIAKYRDLG